jgi:hypothetical protein
MDTPHRWLTPEAAVANLRVALDALDAYRSITGRVGLDDLALLDVLSGLDDHDDHPLADGVTADAAMRRIIALHRDVPVDESGYVWTDHAERVNALTESLGLTV